MAVLLAFSSSSSLCLQLLSYRRTCRPSALLSPEVQSPSSAVKAAVLKGQLGPSESQVSFVCKVGIMLVTLGVLEWTKWRRMV